MKNKLVSIWFEISQILHFKSDNTDRGLNQCLKKKNHVMESNDRKQKHIETNLINNECTWFNTLNTKLVKIFGKVHFILH